MGLLIDAIIGALAAIMPTRVWLGCLGLAVAICALIVGIAWLST